MAPSGWRSAGESSTLAAAVERLSARSTASPGRHAEAALDARAPGTESEPVHAGWRAGAIAAAAVVLTGCGPSFVDAASPPSTTRAGRTSAAPTTPLATPAPTTPAPTPAPTPATAAATRAVPTTAAPTRVVVLDPGHNGGNAGAPAEINRLVPAGGFLKPCNTTGTATNADYPEHAFTFDVAQRAAALLRARGVTVVLTRSDDSGVGPCVDKRAAAANAAGAALVVSIHADGAAAGVRGFHVIEPARAPDGGNAGILGASATAAVDLRAAFAAATGEPPATYPGSLVSAGLTRRDDLAGLNLARVPALFIECANMRNATDAADVSSAAWRQQAAQGIVDGILAFVQPR